MCSLLAVRETLHRYADMVEKYGHEQLAASVIPGRLCEAMSYSFMAGGKRLRPALCMASGALCGLSEQKALPFACALEMIHTYSLIHDDLPAMDDDDLRRGKPSNHKQFDEATAILAGDGLLTDAFAVALKTDVPAPNLLTALMSLAVAAGSPGMVGGQMLDIIYTSAIGTTLEQVAQMQAMKTGAMITAACVCGAQLAAAPAEKVEAMRGYGSSLGKAFQIADDILDIEGNTAVMGKPAGSDAAQGKITYPSLLGLEESRKLAREEVQRAVEYLPEEGIHADFLRGVAALCVDRSF